MSQNVEEIARRVADTGILLWKDAEYLISVIHKLRNERAEWVEREAACCPEDVPFDEMIKAQARRIAALEGAMRGASTFLDTELGDTDLPYDDDSPVFLAFRLLHTALNPAKETSP